MILIISANANERVPKVTTAKEVTSPAFQKAYGFEEAKIIARTECLKYVDKTGLEWDEDEIADAIEETESDNEFTIEFDDGYGDDWYAAKVVRID